MSSIPPSRCRRIGVCAEPAPQIATSPRIGNQLTFLFGEGARVVSGAVAEFLSARGWREDRTKGSTTNLRERMQ